MSLAWFHRLLGVRVGFVAASMWVGCSGASEETTNPGPSDEDAALAVDSRTDRRIDGGRDGAGEIDARLPPPDVNRADTSSGGDTFKPDVSGDVQEFALCLRLEDPQNTNRIPQLSQAVDDQYLALAIADCRVANVVHPPGGTPALVTWRSFLYAWNRDFWGCTDKVAAGFALVSTAQQGITSADAAQLIELYMKAATKVLELTVAEAANMRRDLEKLARLAVTNESTEYALSSCVPEAGAVDVSAPVDAVAKEASDGALGEAEAGPVEAEAGPVEAEAGPVEAEAGPVEAEAGSSDAEGADEGGD